MLKTFLRWGATFVIILCGFIVFLLTPLGSKTLFEVASEFVPGQLKYQHFSGTIIGPLSIEHLDYKNQYVHIIVNHLYLNWHPLALLSGQIAIKNLTIQQMDIITPQKIKTVTPPTAADYLKNLPIPRQLKLPFKLKVEQANISDMRFGHNDQQWLIQLKEGEAKGILMPTQINFQLKGFLKQPQSTTINLKMSGSIQHYHLYFALNNNTSNWNVIGEGSTQSLLLKTQNSQLLSGNLSAELGLKWDGVWQWQLQLNGKQFNLNQVSPLWPKKMDISLHTNGSLIKGQPYFIWDLFLSTPHNTLHSTGAHQATWQANWQINFNNLDELFPGSRGTLQSEGKLSGTWPYFLSNGQLTAHKVVWGGYATDQIQSHWNIDLSQQQSSNLHLLVENAQVLGFIFKQLTIQATGTLRQHTMALAAQNEAIQLNANLSGQWLDHTWKAVLNQLQLNSSWANNWKLQKPTELTISSQKININPLCLTSAANTFCFSLDKENEHWHTLVQSKMNLNQFQSIPSNVQLQAPLTFKFEASGDNQAILQATGNFTLNKSQIVITTDDAVINLPFQINLNLQVKPKNTFFHFSLLINSNNRADIDLQLPDFSENKVREQKQAITGKINIQFKDTKRIANVIPDLTILPGQLLGQWLISGTLANPQITGQMKLLSKILIPRFNTVLENFQIKGTLSNQQFNFKAEATSAGKPVYADGNINFTQNGFPINIHVTANDILIMNTDEFIVYATPDLKINVQGFQVKITGTTVISKAAIIPADIKGVVTLPKYDVVIIGGAQKKPSPWQPDIQVAVTLGKDVDLKAVGLTGRIIGNVIIIHKPEQVTTAIGHLMIVDGRYTILGRTLILAPHSGVTYRQNSLDNPNLDVQVFTRVTVNDMTGQELVMDNVKVGVNISGTASAPRLSFFSSPITLPPNDILSYLVLGSPGSSATSPPSTGLLLQALNALRPEKNKPSADLSSRVKQGLGISELGVETDTTLDPLGEPTNKQKTYVVFGKRITPRLFARYKIDPLSSDNLFTLYYLLTKHIRIQSEKTNLGTGIDILYTFDKKSKNNGITHCDKPQINTTTH